MPVKKNTNSLNATVRCVLPILIYLLIQEVFFMLVMPASASMLSGMLGKEVDYAEFYMNYAAAFTSAAALICIPIMGIMYKKDKQADQVLKPESKPAVMTYIYTVILGIALCIGLSFVVSFMSIRDSVESFNQVETQIFGASFMVQLIGVGFVTPIAEELIFRGLVQNRLRIVLRDKILAIVLTAVLFGIFHGNLVQGIAAGLSALVIGIVYEKYMSLIHAIIMHIIFNLTGICMSAAGVNLSNRVMILVTGIVCLVIVCAIIVCTKPVLKDVFKKKSDVEKRR